MGDSEAMGDSEQLRARFRQQERRLSVISVLLTAIGVTLLAPVLIIAFGQLRSTTSSQTANADARRLVLVLLAILFYLLLTLLTLFRFRWRLAHELERVTRVESRLQMLQKEHPELIALKQVMELVDDQKADASSHRGFWVSFFQNLFFLALGFVLSYFASKLGWLP